MFKEFSSTKEPHFRHPKISLFRLLQCLHSIACKGTAVRDWQVQACWRRKSEPIETLKNTHTHCHDLLDNIFPTRILWAYWLYIGTQHWLSFSRTKENHRQIWDPELLAAGWKLAIQHFLAFDCRLTQADLNNVSTCKGNWLNCQEPETYRNFLAAYWTLLLATFIRHL